MTSRTLARRRPLQLGGLLLAATTLGLATAPAALADDASTAPQSDAATDTAGSGTPLVLSTDPSSTTPADSSTVDTTPNGSVGASSSSAAQATSGAVPPVAATVTPTGAHYGTGKLDLHLDTDDDPLPTGTTLDETGAALELRFSQVNGVPSTASGICDIPSSLTAGPFQSCVLRPGSTVPTQNNGPFGATPSLPPNSAFTLTLVTPPSSGQLLAAPMSVQGWTDGTSNPSGSPYSDFFFPVQHGYRTLGVSVVDGAPAGTTVQLCPAVAGACATGVAPTSKAIDASGLATFGSYLPGDYLVTRGGTATPFTVPAATTTTERDTPLRLTLGTPVVTTPPTTPPTSAPGTATAAVTTLAAGKQQTVTAGGFTPGETVRGTLHSTPIDLGTAVADAQGVATFTFTVPADLEVGVHTVTALGLSSGTTSTVAFTVTATEAAALATTGFEVAPVLGVGALALGAGAALTVVGSRRRRG